MKKLFLALVLLFAPSLAFAQCNGIFPNNTVCGNISGGPNIPGQVPSTSLPGLGLVNGTSTVTGPGTNSGGPIINNAGIVSNPSPSGWFDSAFCNTVGWMIARTTGGWVCNGNIPVNARWLGATGNNSTDDTAALQNAINAAQVLHGSVYIPGGIYKISTALSITSHITIYGDGSQHIAGLCGIAGNCSTVLAAAQIANSTTIVPAAGINGIVASTNDAITLRDFQIVYLSLPSVGSGVTAIKVVGAGGSFGVNGGTHIFNMLIAQADIDIQMNDAFSYWIDHNTFYNFLTTAIGIGGTGIAGGSDFNITDNFITTGPSTTTGQCLGIAMTVSAAPHISGNEFNYNVSNSSGCIMIMINPAVNGTSIEPVRIVDNSLEGNGAGIVFYNSCPTPATCLVSQIYIGHNQIWTGGGFNQGANIVTVSSSGVLMTNGAVITDNILNVVGGITPVVNNVNISLGAGSATNISIANNLFGNTSTNGSTSIGSGGSNTNIKTSNNQVQINDNQSLGVASVSLTCNVTYTNTNLNAVQGYLYAGAGVTNMVKNGATAYGQASGALTGSFTVILQPGDTFNPACSGSLPTNVWYSFNP